MSTTTAVTPRVAWRVSIYELSCIVFAETKARAQWIAVREYRDAFSERRGTWPPAHAARCPVYDNSPFKNDKPRCYTEEFIR